MGAAPDQPRLLEPVHEHGDRPEVSDRRSPSWRWVSGPFGFEVLERVEVGRADAGRAGERGASVSFQAEPLQAGRHHV